MTLIKIRANPVTGNFFQGFRLCLNLYQPVKYGGI